MHSISLDGTWSVRPETYALTGEAGLTHVIQQADGWLPAQVPGEIHLDLIRAGQMPEPSVGTNMPECRWPETKAWWYRTTFTVDAFWPERQTGVRRLDPTPRSSSTALAGEAVNAFVPAVFIKPPSPQRERARAPPPGPRAKDGAPHPEQTLASIKAVPKSNPPQPGDLTGHRLWGGRKWLRKAQFSYGWDWVEALPNIGVWRSVHLEGRSGVTLPDLRLDTLLEGGQVRLELAAAFDNRTPGANAPASRADLRRRPAAPLNASIPIAQPGRSYLADI
jgi:beta-mannosidase